MPIFFLSCFFSANPPSTQLYILVVFLLLVACGILPQCGLMSGAMSTPRIRTSKTPGRGSGACELNHLAMGPAPRIHFFSDLLILILTLAVRQIPFSDSRTPFKIITKMMYGRNPPAPPNQCVCPVQY